MRKWLCIVDCNRITSIWLISESLLILIWGEKSPPTQAWFIVAFCLKYWRTDLGGGITVQHNVIWSVYLSPFIYILQNLHLRKRILVSRFTAYDLYFNIPKVITSGLSIVISTNFTSIEIFLPFYTSKKKSKWLFVTNTIASHSK